MKEILNTIQEDLPFLMEDVADYLLERYSSIGINFLKEFPHSYTDSNKMFLIDETNKVRTILTISLP